MLISFIGVFMTPSKTASAMGDSAHSSHQTYPARLASHPDHWKVQMQLSRAVQIRLTRLDVPPLAENEYLASLERNKWLLVTKPDRPSGSAIHSTFN
jgi:hypothetical protein